MLVEQDREGSGTAIVSFSHTPSQRLRVVAGDIRDLIDAPEAYVADVASAPGLEYDAMKMGRQ